MHPTNLQLVLLLFAASNLTAYLLGRRHGRAAPLSTHKLAVGTVKIRRRS